jgi:L-iditol 2-dehydrogenase
MKSALLIEKNRIEILEKDKPRAMPGEVTIKIAACGICRTDVKCSQTGQRDLQYPRVLGHEMVGWIHELGEGVSIYESGDLVQVSPGVFCGECSHCKAGQDNLCDSIDILGFTLDGGFQEYLRIPARGVKNGILNRVPEGRDIVVATFAEPLACCINMQDKMKLGKLSPLLIVGAGRLGVLQMMLAKKRGVRKVFAMESSAYRRKRAVELGFDAAFDPDCQALVEEIQLAAGTKGIGAVIQCCPFGGSTDLGLKLLNKGGQFGYFSGLHEVQDIDWNLIHYKEIQMIGAYGCTARQNAKALELLTELPVDDLVGKILPLEELETGLREMRDLEELYSIIIENKEEQQNGK